MKLEAAMLKYGCGQMCIMLMRVLIYFILLSLLMPVAAFSHEITVGVPSLGNEYSKGDYIVSESDGVMAGIVSRGVTKDSRVSGGYVQLTQDAPGNKFYVLFTKGAHENIDSRLNYLTDNSFESFYSPSFGFELKTAKHVMIKAAYDDIDILGSERLRPGNYYLTIRYERLVGGMPQISVSRSD